MFNSLRTKKQKGVKIQEKNNITKKRDSLHANCLTSMFRMCILKYTGYEFIRQKIEHFLLILFRVILAKEQVR